MIYQLFLYYMKTRKLKIIKTLIVISLLAMVVACNQQINKKQTGMEKQDQENLKMDISEYWRIIGLSARESDGDEEEQMIILHELLMEHTAEDILEFMRIEAKLMDEAVHYNVVYAYAIINGMELCDAGTDRLYVSDDGFLHFRIWLMHQGEAMYTGTLEDPDFLADKVNPSDETWQEMIAVTGIQAYMEKTGSYGLPESYKQSVRSDETVKGTRYPVKELPEKFPKLWAKFMK